MQNKLFLTDEELVELTGAKRKANQIRWLAQHRYPPKLSDERILELFAEHSKQYNWPFGFARAIEREILGSTQ